MNPTQEDSLATRTIQSITNYIEKKPVSRALPVMTAACTIGTATAITAAIGLTEIIATAYHYTKGNDHIAAVSYKNLAFLATAGGLVGATSLIATLIFDYNIIDDIIENLMIKSKQPKTI